MWDSEYSSVTNFHLLQPFDPTVPLSLPPMCVTTKMYHIPKIQNLFSLAEFFGRYISFLSQTEKRGKLDKCKTGGKEKRVGGRQEIETKFRNL